MVEILAFLTRSQVLLHHWSRFPEPAPRPHPSLLHQHLQGGTEVWAVGFLRLPRDPKVTDKPETFYSSEQAGQLFHIPFIQKEPFDPFGHGTWLEWRKPVSPSCAGFLFTQFIPLSAYLLTPTCLVHSFMGTSLSSFNTPPTYLLLTCHLISYLSPPFLHLFAHSPPTVILAHLFSCLTLEQGEWEKDDEDNGPRHVGFSLLPPTPSPPSPRT